MISLIIPFYNEKTKLPPHLRDIEVFIQDNPGIITEVILVDDCSKDGGQTLERALYFIDRLPLKIIQLDVNQGKWGAIHAGMNASIEDTVLLLDADGSASVWELERLQKRYNLLDIVRNKTAVFGSRFMIGSRVQGKSALRTIFSRGYRFYIKILYKLAGGEHYVDDMQAPWKLFNKDAIFLDLEEERWAGDVELALALDCQIINFPLNFIHMSGSKVKTGNIFSMAWSALRICTRHKTRVRKSYKYSASNLKEYNEEQ